MPLLSVSLRAAGKRKPLVPDWQLPWPPEENLEGEPLTLRRLITRVVLQEVKDFQKRQRERSFARILTERQIEQDLGRGKVDAGGRQGNQDVQPEQAVATALQAFEDGIYLVVLDGEEQRDLDKEVFVGADSNLVFIRLTLLAGR